MNLDIDKIRSSGGLAEVDSKEDGGVVDMLSIGDRLIVIKDHSVYELLMADTVETERKTAKIPQLIQKKLIKKSPDEPDLSPQNWSIYK